VYDSYFQPYELRTDLFSQHRLSYLPQSSRAMGSAVLITSRNRIATLGATTITVPPFTQAEAVNLLLQLSSAEAPQTISTTNATMVNHKGADVVSAGVMTHVLGFHPLALQHMNSYTRETGISLSEVLDELEQHLELPGRVLRGSPYPVDLSTAFCHTLARLSTVVLDVLYLLAFLNPDVLDEKTILKTVTFLSQSGCSMNTRSGLFDRSQG